MSNYIDTIEGLQKPAVIKIRPNPKDIAPIYRLVKRLNQAYHREEKGPLCRIAWYAFFPWQNNPQKKWILACTCLATTRDRGVIAMTIGFKKSNPHVDFEIQCVYGPRYFEMRDEIGLFI